MTRAIQCVLVSTAVVLALAGKGIAQSQAEHGDSKTDEKKTELKTSGKDVAQTLVGTWRAESISVALPDGGRKTLSGADRPMSVVISEKACTIRSGATTIAALTYVLDQKHDPWIIDMKSKDGELLGICAEQGDRLEISLDDPAKGRPGDFDKEKHGMVLDLRRFPASSPQKVDEQRKPLTLDLSRFRRPVNKVYESLAGRQVIDGLPFEIGGQVRLSGRTPIAHGERGFPDSVKGIRIGRTFDELCLIHHTNWPDVDGQAVAYICLNYADGTKYIFPINYGVHVRDWYNLLSYEKETVADADTTICWRHAPVEYKAPIRIFKSSFVNPSPEKAVETMDIVSARIRRRMT